MGLNFKYSYINIKHAQITQVCERGYKWDYAPRISRSKILNVEIRYVTQDFQITN